MVTNDILPDRAAHWNTFDTGDADGQIIGAAEECQCGNVKGQRSGGVVADDTPKQTGPCVFFLLINAHRSVTRHDPVVDFVIFAGRQDHTEFRARYHLIERRVDALDGLRERAEDFRRSEHDR